MNEEAWFRFEGESKVAFDAFEIYLNLGTERTNKATAKRVGKSVQLMDRWSSKNEWVRRARAWDNHNTKMFQDQYDNATVEIARRQARIGKTLQSVGMQHVEKLEGEDVRMNYHNAVSTIKTGVDIERVAMGQATQVISNDLKVGVGMVQGQTTEELIARIGHLLNDNEDDE